VSKEYGDKRDVGLRFAKTFEYFGYSAGLFNGAGANNLDADNAKDGALRLEGYPIKDMVLGGVAYATLWDRKKAGLKDRWELDARYDLGDVLIQAEYLRASEAAPAKTGVDAQGFYAAVAVRLLDKKLEPAVRVGYYDPNTNANVDPATAKGKDEAWHVEGGLTYYIQKQEARVQLNYGHFAYDDKKANNEVILATQFSF
jgi:predicted porin